MKPVVAGFLPLLDSAVLVAARERGFAAAEGIDLSLVKETSWATLRDRLSVGQFDVAHVLAPLPIAQNLGLMPLKTKLVVPFALGLGGNAITVSVSLAGQMQTQGFRADGTANHAGQALRQVIQDRVQNALSPLVFGVVHAFSSHAYELRYWLAASGINPDRDVSIVVVPPSLLPDALASGEVDGFCVGEPWNSLCVLRGDGAIVTTKSQIWKSSPEKVLVARKEWSERQRDSLLHVIRALHRAAQWCADPDHAAELAQMMAGVAYLNTDPALLLNSLMGRLPGHGHQSDFLLFFQRAANFPWQSHASWFFSQMVRWHEVDYSPEAAEQARMTYRPDIYRAALSGLDAQLPGASSKVEGALLQTTPMPALNGPIDLGPDGFFDGQRFDPERIQDYLRALP